MKTVSLESAKQLKEKGYPQQSSYFWWTSALRTNGKEEFYLPNDFIVDIGELNEFDYRKDYAAPTVDEVLDLLPERIEGYKTLGMGKVMGEWVIGYQKIGNELQAIRTVDKSLADAAAKMWLYLKENNLLC